MSDVVVLVAEGFEEIEALTVVNVLRRGQVKVVLMSVSGEQLVRGSRGIRVEADALFDPEIIMRAHGIVLPGGAEGTANMVEFQPLKEILSVIQKTHLIGAICAAPYVLAHHGLLDGKRTTANPDYKERVANHPVIFLDEPLVRDGNIVTSRGMGTSLIFALELLGILKGQEVRKSVEKGVEFQALVNYIRELT